MNPVVTGTIIYRVGLEVKFFVENRGTIQRRYVKFLLFLQPRRGDISVEMPFPSGLSPVGAIFVFFDKIFTHPFSKTI